jgi:isoquinoline 1-oxidoreductase beta subunit
MPSRRDALRLIAGGGALLLSAAWYPSVGEARADSGNARSVKAVPITAWVRIAPDGSVTLIASQSEMGQGTTTTLAAALADELYLSLDRVRIEFATFDPSYRDPVYQWMFTGNSQSTSSFYELMRKMGAAAREMLVAAAAARLSVSGDSLSLEHGSVCHTASGRSIGFGEIAAEASRMPIPTNPRPRLDPALAGRPVPRWDIPSKVDGSAVFGIDVKLPGMLLAAVRCAPRFGATLLHYDAAAIRAKPGVIAVVEVPNGLAVVARTYWEAKRALETAELTWSDRGSSLTATAGLPAIYHEQLASGSFATLKSEGNPADALGKAPLRRTAVFEIPFQAHATMEPMNCTVHLAHGRCEVWAPTQGMEMSQNVAMQVTGLPREKITIHRTLIGGGFGRRLLADFLKQTLIIAMAVKAPVKLIWSREEDMTHDAYRPAMLHEISGALDSSGTLVGLTHRVVSPSHMLYIFVRTPQQKDWTEPTLPPSQYDLMAVEGVLEIPYGISNQLVQWHRLDLDVPVSVWRTTGHGPNNFALESFIDELALAAGKDPLSFRRAALGKNARAGKVLDTLAEKSGWGSPPPAGTARGMAIASAFGGLVGCVTELSVNGSEVKVHRIVSVVDCGRTIDPGIATSNILGGIVWGLSGMRTSVDFVNGRTVQSNFNGFDPIHLWETPPCEVYFLESGGPLGGTGELGPVPVHAAVCNAIFAATGKRIRSLPLSRSGLSFV